MASTEPWIRPVGEERVEVSLATLQLPRPDVTVAASYRRAVTGIELAPLERIARSRTPAWHARATG